MRAIRIIPPHVPSVKCFTWCRGGEVVGNYTLFLLSAIIMLIKYWRGDGIRVPSILLTRSQGTMHAPASVAKYVCMSHADGRSDEELKRGRQMRGDCGRGHILDISLKCDGHISIDARISQRRRIGSSDPPPK